MPVRHSKGPLVGSGVFYGAAVGESRAMQDQDVFIVGAGNSAGQASLHLAKHARAVTPIVRGRSIDASMSSYLVHSIESTPNVVVRHRTEVIDGGGNGHLESLPQGNSERSREPLSLETSMPGVFAAGDVRQGSIKRVASAVGDGATVVRMLHEYLRVDEVKVASERLVSG